MAELASVEITQIGEVLKEQLKKININVTVQPLEIGTFAKNNADGNFEWAVTRRAMRGDPSGFVADFDPNGTTYNVYFKGGYQNSELDRLRLEALQITNQAKRLPLYRRMQEIMLTDLAMIPLVDPYVYQVVRKRLRGMYVSYDGTERGLIEAWIIK